MKQKRKICGTETAFCMVTGCISASAIGADSCGVLPHTEILRFYPLQFVLGLLLLLYAVHLYCDAVLYAQAHEQRHCENCPYYSGGVYAKCRNPRCAAALFFAAGVFLIDGNAWLLLLLPMLRVLLSVFMMHTEKRLERFCGAEYTAYKNRVNRCMPVKHKNKVMIKV